jgi:geranylgeranyl diphosphate synthase type I
MTSAVSARSDGAAAVSDGTSTVRVHADNRGGSSPDQHHDTHDETAVERTLAATDRLLEEVCSRLAQQWRARGTGPVPMLEQDLPELLRSWLLPPAGKRLRPLMCHWGWAAAWGASRGGRQDTVTICAALELVHLFALVHDDVMDRSSSRRGRPTVHLQAAREMVDANGAGDPGLFGDSIAILFGDLVLTEAWDLVGSLGPSLRRAWADMLRELVHGQLLDITGAAARSREMSAARTVARLKSGAYTVQRPLELGALAAGADAPTLAALGSYGRHLGEAFAIRDDILGVWGDPKRTGKPVGDDLLSGKPTVLIAEAAAMLPEDIAARHLGPGATVAAAEVPALQRAMLDAGVRDRAEARIATEVAQASSALDAADLDPRAVAKLRALALTIAWRES